MIEDALLTLVFNPESGIGGQTQELHTHGAIGLAEAAAVSDARRNGTMGMRPVYNANGRVTWKRGFVAEQDQRLAYSLLTAARRSLVEQRVKNRKQVQDYIVRRRERRKRRKKAQEKKVADSLAKAFELHMLYYKSPIIVKDEDRVDEWLANIDTKGKKMEAVKLNFRAREIGLGLTQFHQVSVYFSLEVRYIN